MDQKTNEIDHPILIVTIKFQPNENKT